MQGDQHATRFFSDYYFYSSDWTLYGRERERKGRTQLPLVLGPRPSLGKGLSFLIRKPEGPGPRAGIIPLDQIRPGVRLRLGTPATARSAVPTFHGVLESRRTLRKDEPPAWMPGTRPKLKKDTLERKRESGVCHKRLVACPVSQCVRKDAALIFTNHHPTVRWATPWVQGTLSGLGDPLEPWAKIWDSITLRRPLKGTFKGSEKRFSTSCSKVWASSVHRASSSCRPRRMRAAIRKVSALAAP